MPSLVAQIFARRQGVSRSPELERIIALPRRVLNLSDVPDLTPLFRQPTGTWKLRPAQSAALFEMEAAQGGLIPMPVGGGKTLTSLLAPYALESKCAVYLVEPQLRDQLKRVDIPKYGAQFKLPLHVLHLVAYSELRSTKKADILTKLKPDLIIADEAHNLKNKGSVQTRRFLWYMKLNPGCRFVALSGTMTSKSLRDYAHLSELALRERSPLPRGMSGHWSTLEEWADAIDVAPRNPMDPGQLIRLCAPGESVRSGFRRRLVETQGVVAGDDGELGVSLVIRKLDVKVPKAITEALDHLRATWEIGGEELEDAVAFYRVARQLALGFYYKWAWPGGVVDHEWLQARSEWHRAVRSFLRYRAKPGIDSPLLLARAIDQGVVEIPEFAAWNAVKDRPQPPTEAVWLDKTLIRDAVVEFAVKEPGIVWYEHTAVGDLLASWKMMVYGAGEQPGLLNEKGDRTIACSIRAHSTGKNLQMFSRNLILSPPSSGKTWQQLLGRSHRPGQEADCVTADVLLHTPELEHAWMNALAGAEYIQETQGSRQKLMYATKVGL